MRRTFKDCFEPTGFRLYLALQVKVALALVVVSIGTIFLSVSTQAAGLLMSINDINSSTNGGTFEVDLTNQASATSYGIAGFSIELIAPASLGIQFVDAITSTTASTYIFDGTGTASIDPSFSFFSGPTPSMDLTVGDVEWADPFISVDPGKTFGLALVAYTLTPGSLDDLTTLIFGAGTSVSNADGSSLAFNTTTFATGTVPEPSSIVLLTIASSSLLWVVSRNVFNR